MSQQSEAGRAHVAKPIRGPGGCRWLPSELGDRRVAALVPEVAGWVVGRASGKFIWRDLNAKPAPGLHLQERAFPVTGLGPRPVPSPSCAHLPGHAQPVHWCWSRPHARGCFPLEMEQHALKRDSALRRGRHPHVREKNAVLFPFPHDPGDQRDSAGIRGPQAELGLGFTCPGAPWPCPGGPAGRRTPWPLTLNKNMMLIFKPEGPSEEKEMEKHSPNSSRLGFFLTDSEARQKCGDKGQVQMQGAYFSPASKPAKH